ncbi:unnamed protein product [Camellia sinensis]
MSQERMEVLDAYSLPSPGVIRERERERERERGYSNYLVTREEKELLENSISRIEKELNSRKQGFKERKRKFIKKLINQEF